MPFLQIQHTNPYLHHYHYQKIPRQHPLLLTFLKTGQLFFHIDCFLLVQQYFKDEFENNTNLNNEQTDEMSENQKLFDQDNIEEEEDFEIPAFLRKQKF